MNKKAFGPVVAVALLIVVSVVAVLGFQTWYQTYSSQIFSQSEANSNSGGMNTGIANVINSELYFNNGLNDNITIENIKVNNEECYIYDGNYSPGISKFNLYNCLKDINTSTAEVVVISNQGLFTKEIYLDSKTVSSTPIKSEPIYTTTFISVWNTSENGISNSNQIKLPLASGGTYDFTINWGDGTIENITDYNDDTHTYTNPGIYTIKITGIIEDWAFNKESVWSVNDYDLDDGDKILEIKQWGPLKISRYSGEQFLHCHNLDITAKDTLNTSEVTSMGGMFAFNYNLKGSDSFNIWDVSQVTDLSNMFNRAENFSADISGWNTSSVRSLQSTFYNAKSFNSDLSSWDVSSVTNMYSLFSRAKIFTSDLSSWDVSNVKKMGWMLSNVHNFTSDIGNWDVSQVTDMRGLFMGLDYFNVDLSKWNTSNVVDMANMFYYASNFNQSLDSWNTSSVTTMKGMFFGADSFDQDLNNWDTSSVETMYQMFYVAVNFNGNISNWDVISVTDMRMMFSGVKKFNQDLSGWDVSSVINYTSFDNGADAWNETFKPNFED